MTAVSLLVWPGIGREFPVVNSVNFLSFSSYNNLEEVLIKSFAHFFTLQLKLHNHLKFQRTLFDNEDI